MPPTDVGQMEINMPKTILNYTRKPISNILYDPRLAYSMHLAIRQEDGKFYPLNHNSGVLFALATENADGSLNPKSIQKPYLFHLKDGCFGILAIRIEGDGGFDEESKGCVIYFTSNDLVIYHEVGLLPLSEKAITQIACQYNEESEEYQLFWQDCTNDLYEATIKDLTTLKLSSIPKKLDNSTGLGINSLMEPLKEEDYPLIEGVVPENMIEVSDEVAEYLYKKMMTPVNVGVEVPKQIVFDHNQKLEDMKVKALYSDGTYAIKRVEWNFDGIDFTKKGNYKLRGRIHQDHFEFPVALNRADPCVAKWKDKYYFIATNDADNNHTLYIREADTIPELVHAKETLLLDSSTYEDIGNLLWAPEFHEVNGKLYIFHAATPGEFFCEESHIMELREGGNPCCREDWSRPRRIVKKDGSDLCNAGETITLDMTCFFWEGGYYVIWSQRQFLPKDLGAWLYIAKLNPEKPWQLLTNPIVLSKPDYGWANNHTFVDEGPFALIQEDRLFVTFSSAAVDTSYVVCYLVIEKGKDPLNPKNWRKNNYPILTSRSVEGEYGTGHNAYVIDEYGTVWNTYHARPGVDGVRSSGIRRVHFDIDGCPVLDMTEELDVLEEYKEIETELIIR